MNEDPKYIETLKAIKEMKKVPYKMNHDPKELLKFQRMKVTDLMLEKEFLWSYIEIEIFLEPMKG